MGSNVKDGLSLLEECCKNVAAVTASSRFSTCYRTSPVGSMPSPDYHNCVGIVETEWDYDRLHDAFKALEKAAGRTPESKCRGEVPLDIDIVVWNGEVKRPRDMEQAYIRIGLSQLE